MKRPKSPYRRKVAYITAHGHWEKQEQEGWLRFVFDRPLTCRANELVMVKYPAPPVKVRCFTATVPSHKFRLFDARISHDPMFFPTNEPFKGIVLMVDEK